MKPKTDRCPVCHGPLVFCIVPAALQDILPPIQRWWCFRCNCFLSYHLEPTAKGSRRILAPDAEG